MGYNDGIVAGRQAVMRIFCAITYLEAVNADLTIYCFLAVTNAMQNKIHDK